MNIASRLARLARRWFAAALGEDPGLASPEADADRRVGSDKERQSLDELNRALSAAVNLRDTLGAQVETLCRRQIRVEKGLAEAVRADDATAGARFALELQELADELPGREAQWSEARERAEAITTTREELIAGIRRRRGRRGS
ncbi:MAG: hypothetical protein ACYDC1_06590 [Limisphaerales bacterium]